MGNPRHPPYGPWEHVPPHVWTNKSNSATTQDEAEDEAKVCVCCVARSAPPSQFVLSVKSTTVLNVLTPTLVGPIQRTFGVVEFTAIALLCNVLCREGVQSNVVYLGGLSMRG